MLRLQAAAQDRPFHSAWTKEPAEVAVGDAPDTPEETPRSSRALFCRKSSTAMRGIKELWGDITRLNYAAGILVFVALILWGLLVCVALLPEPKPEAPDAEQFRAELAKRREYLKSLKDKPTSRASRSPEPPPHLDQDLPLR